MARVDCEVSPDGVLVPVGVFKEKPSAADPPAANRRTALVDTGATCTGVTRQLINHLGIRTRTSTLTVQTASDPQPQPGVECDIYLSIPIAPAPPNAAAQTTLLETWLTVFRIEDTPEHDVLLGMDILADCYFFCGEGQFVMTYPPRPLLRRMVNWLAR